MRNQTDNFQESTVIEMVPDFDDGVVLDTNHNQFEQWFAGLRGDIEMQFSKVPATATLEIMPANLLFQASEAALRGGDMETRNALLEEARKRDDEWGRMADLTLKIEELRHLVEDAKER